MATLLLPPVRPSLCDKHKGNASNQVLKDGRHPAKRSTLVPQGFAGAGFTSELSPEDAKAMDSCSS